MGLLQREARYGVSGRDVGGEVFGVTGDVNLEGEAQGAEESASAGGAGGEDEGDGEAYHGLSSGGGEAAACVTEGADGGFPSKPPSPKNGEGAARRS